MDNRYHDIEWRFSGLRPNVFGLDPLVVLVVPLAFAGLRWQFPMLWFYLLAAFTALTVYVAFVTPYRRIADYLRALSTKYIQRGRWSVE